MPRSRAAAHRTGPGQRQGDHQGGKCLDLRGGRQDPVAGSAPDGQRGRLLHRLEEPGHQRDGQYRLGSARTRAAQRHIPNNFIKNAGESRVYGTEIELSLAATDNLLLTLNYGLQDTKLLEYSQRSWPPSRSIRTSPASRRRSVPARVTADTGVSVSGNEAPRVPKNTVTASATYTASAGRPGCRLVSPGRLCLQLEDLARRGEPDLRRGSQPGECATRRGDGQLDRVLLRGQRAG